MEETYDSKLECLDWRHSAAIIGLNQYFKFENREYDRINFRQNRDSIEYNSSDINKSRYLAFAEYFFRKDMLHMEIEGSLSREEFNEEQIKNINDKLTGKSANTVMKRVFAKLNFDGHNKQQILELINDNRELIIYETFKHKKNLYANFCNTNLLLCDKQPHCRLLGYNVDEGRKSRSIAYNFNRNSFVAVDMMEFDFIPFAFSDTYDSLFLNNNSSIENLIKTNRELIRIVNEELSNVSNGNAKTALFKGIVTSAEFIDYDVEAIVKNREDSYFQSLFIRKEAIQILKSIGDLKAFSISYKVNDNYYINIQSEVINCVLNQLITDGLIELLLKSERNYQYIISRLISVNLKIKGVDSVTEGMKGAYACAKKVTEKIEKNKVSAYKKKLISAIVAEDYGKVCDILLQLSSYSEISFGFAYDLFEDFEKNKELVYTFINALGNYKEEK